MDGVIVPGVPRTLDFVVIGAAKSGTTTLWRALESHPAIATPADKERGFFHADQRFAKGMDRFIRSTFPRASAEQRLGTVTPQCMDPERVDLVVDRMATTAPDIRLVAILREPIDRAISRFRQLRREGRARGSTLDDHLAACALGEDDVVTGGEYGRILSRYLDRFAPEQLCVLFTEDLDKQPAATYRRLFRFLGVSDHHIPPLDTRHNPGGTRTRVEPPALDELLAHLDDAVWPVLDAPPDVRRGVAWWLRRVWNVAPDHEGLSIGDGLRAVLQQRYLADSVLLTDRTGIDPPWRSRYERALSPRAETTQRLA